MKALKLTLITVTILLFIVWLDYGWASLESVMWGKPDLLASAITLGLTLVMVWWIRFSLQISRKTDKD